MFLTRNVMEIYPLAIWHPQVIGVVGVHSTLANLTLTSTIWIGQPRERLGSQRLLLVFSVSPPRQLILECAIRYLGCHFLCTGDFPVGDSQTAGLAPVDYLTKQESCFLPVQTTSTNYKYSTLPKTGHNVKFHYSFRRASLEAHTFLASAGF